MKYKLILFLSVFVLSGSMNLVHAQETQSTKLSVLDLKNVDIHDALKFISQKSGLNIVAGQKVKGRINIYLKDIEPLDALNVISQSNGWAYVQDENLIQMMSAKEYEERFGIVFGQTNEIHLAHLKYVTPKQIQPFLNQLKSKNGQVMADETQNTIFLMDIPSKIEQMKDVILQMDTQKQTTVFDFESVRHDQERFEKLAKNILSSSENLFIDPVSKRVIVSGSEIQLSLLKKMWGNVSADVGVGTFHLKYAKGSDILDQLKNKLTPQGIVDFDERTGWLSVTDTSESLDDLRLWIEKIDQREREVLIEAKIVQVVLNDERKWGVDWQGLVEKHHDLTFTSDFDQLLTTDKRGQISIGSIADDQYTAVLEALETVGETDILSSPRVVALDGKEAKILVGSTEPYVTTTVTTPASGPTTTAESVNFIDVGVKLYVTPDIHPDDYITMSIRPEVSSVVSTLITSNNNTIPVVETSEIETVVRVKDQQTIILGGLIKDENSVTNRQIPWLGKIPILGIPFRNQRDVTKKTEIAVFLTPRIISSAEDLSHQMIGYEVIEQ